MLTNISVRGAREHNLKGVDIDIPRESLTVITGLSGSGKSSLAFDTIYAEGQRRYVESLSAYARQFLEMMQKPDVEHIDGLSPAISIEQKTTSKNPRSTVATVTEIYDYMRLLWARVGVPYSPATGEPIEAQQVSQMVDRTMTLPVKSRHLLLAPVIRGRKGEYKKELAEWQKAGFTRVRIDGEVYPIEEAPALDKKYKHDIEIVVDRIAIKEGIEARLADSFETALKLSGGLAYLDPVDPPEDAATASGMKLDNAPPGRLVFSEKFACPVSGFTIEEVEPRLFSFNAPQGACPACDGLGQRMEFDEDLVVPNQNPDVSLHVCRVDGAPPTEVVWDRAAFEYLAKVSWNRHGLAVTVLSRDQRDLQVLAVDPTTGTTTRVVADHDEAWVELVPGTGVLVAPGRAVACADRDGARRLLIGDEIVSPPDVQVRSVVDATAERVVVTGNPVDDATVQHVYRWTLGDGFTALTDGLGVHTAAVGGDTVVLRSATIDEPGARWRLPSGSRLASNAERPLVRPAVRLTTHSTTTPTTAVLLPHDHDGSPLPVLLDPYGGPHAQRVVRSHNAFCASQWFADQGFAVVVADGRGTPGRGSDHERAVLNDLARGVLDDQVTALHAAAERHPELDLGRVAIRGWSFGGYLSALAVMCRPDVFHAAIAGAPVTEWRLYDTCYTERYLGDPNEQPDVYDANSLLPLASELTRPLLLIHGLADDNVVAAHTLRLSAALLAAGKPHEVLPLVGVTHMTPQEVVAEHLLLHQLDFLRRSLAI